MEGAWVVTNGWYAKGKRLARRSQFDSRASTSDWSGHVRPAIRTMENRSYRYGASEVCDLERHSPRLVSYLQRVLRVVAIKNGRSLLMSPLIVLHLGNQISVLVPDFNSHQQPSIRMSN